MKCPKCGGSGFDVVHGFDCVSCDGKGEIEVTNEEWFCTLSTEEKAKFFDKICYSAWGDINSRFRDMADYTDWIAWLKEIHDDLS